MFLAVKSEQDRTELARTRAVMTGDVIDIDDGSPDLAALAREREARRGSPPAPAPVATGAPLSLNFGPPRAPSGRFGQVGRHRRLKRLRLGTRRRYVSRYFV